MKSRNELLSLCTLCFVLLSAGAAFGETYSLTVKGTDVIFLAGRTDVTIPALDVMDPTFPILRHGYVPPPADFLQETFPQSVPATGDMVFTFTATGGINFFNGYGTKFPPDGGDPNGSALYSLAGISGYQGPQGALAGVFLDGANPVSSTPPATLNFWASDLGISFTELRPAVGQVFFIGDGVTADAATQRFIAPHGATRLFLGIPDGWSFYNGPGYYEDNDGAYQADVKAFNPVVAAMVDVRPDTLNMGSQGNPVTVYIELPEGYSVEAIDPTSAVISAVGGQTLVDPLPFVTPWGIGDEDMDGISDLMVKFDRQQLIPLVQPGTTAITVSGLLVDGTRWEGNDTIRVISR